MADMFCFQKSSKKRLGVRHANRAVALRRTVLEGRAFCRDLLCDGVSLDPGGKPMTALRIRFLMRVHGLTDAQARAYAVLIWGAK